MAPAWRAGLVVLGLASLPRRHAAALSCLNDCSHHGECSDGVCVCEAAYTGEPPNAQPASPSRPRVHAGVRRGRGGRARRSPLAAS